MIIYLGFLVISGLIAFLLSTYCIQVNFVTDNNINQSPSTLVENNIPEKLIVYYNSEPYNITDFVKNHPGGKDILIENANQDFTIDAELCT